MYIECYNLIAISLCAAVSPKFFLIMNYVPLKPSALEGYGPDGVPYTVLKNWSSILTLTVHTFQSIWTSTFSSCWKFSYIKAVPEKDGLCNLSKYRPVALISFLPKFSKYIFICQILKQLSNGNSLSDWQYAHYRSPDLLKRLWWNLSCCWDISMTYRVWHLPNFTPTDSILLVNLSLWPIYYSR